MTLILMLVLGGCILALSVISYLIMGEGVLPDWQNIEEMSPEKELFFLCANFCCAPIGSLIEELLFRAPLSIVGKLAPRSVAPLVGAILLSIVFGWIHGGIGTIVSHGSLGMILAVAYLKLGGHHGKFWAPLLYTTMIHAAYDMILSGLATMLLITSMPAQ